MGVIGYMISFVFNKVKQPHSGVFLRLRLNTRCRGVAEQFKYLVVLHAPCCIWWATGAALA